MASILSDSGTLTTPAIPTPAGVTPKPCHSDAREPQRQQASPRNPVIPTPASINLENFVIPTPASASEPGGICFSPPFHHRHPNASNPENFVIPMPASGNPENFVIPTPASVSEPGGICFSLPAATSL